jgi:hypothetical protein
LLFSSSHLSVLLITGSSTLAFFAFGLSDILNFDSPNIKILELLVCWYQASQYLNSGSSFI